MSEFEEGLSDETEILGDMITEVLEEEAYDALSRLGYASGDMVIARYLQVRHVRRNVDPVIHSEHTKEEGG